MIAMTAGCEGEKPPAAKDDKAGAASDAKTKAADPAEAKAIELEEISDEGLGYTIQIPKGAKTLQKTDMAHTYSLPLPGGLFEYNVHLTGAEMKDLADLERMATMMGGKEIDEKKELEGGGYMVVKKPETKILEVWVAKKGKKAVTAKCSAPVTEKEKLIEICTSLEAT